jgi:hypothetical protein
MIDEQILYFYKKAILVVDGKKMMNNLLELNSKKDRKKTYVTFERALQVLETIWKIT